MFQARHRWCSASLCAGLLLCLRGGPLSAQTDFLRGDVNCNGAVTTVDAYLILEVLFNGMAAPCDCEAAYDVDCDGVAGAADSVSLFGFLLLGGAAPCAPFPACGAPAAGGLPCVAYPACPLFKRGDADQDGCVSPADATYILDYLSLIGLAPDCFQSADANDDDLVNLTDATFILGYCSGVGGAPPLPGPLSCGTDPTPGALTCVSYPATACAAGCVNQLPSDCNQDGMLDISDGICILGFLFLGTPAVLPCGNGAANHPSNVRMNDANGDNSLDLSDGVYLLTYLFNAGLAPVLGTTCVYIEDCPQNRSCPTCSP